MIEEKIMTRLKEHWNFLISLGYNEDRMLGIFACGSMNYNFYNPKISDVDSKVIIIPSFADMCLEKRWFSHEYKYENEHIKVEDIRMTREMFIKQNINYIEILYSEYFILNPKYEELFKTYFVNNRELISHYDRKKTMQSISGQLLHSLKQNPIDDKSLYNSCRLTFFLEHYLHGDEYIKCIKPDGEAHTFLWEMKYGTSKKYDTLELKTELIGKLEKSIKKLNEQYAEIQSQDSEAALTALNSGTIEILKYSFEEHNSKSVSKKDFFKRLTNAETKAYYSIISEIGVEGNITISKLVEKNSISRPVYNNLITKMKESNVASVVNMGMKGTYIKILEAQMKAEALN